tara:strand:+ start:363 stop:647 length:285 start_codon:yes stop_codon:yes gene_type:complete
MSPVRKPLSNIGGITIYNTDFIMAWEASASATEVCKKLHIPESKVSCRKVANLASRLRTRGIALIKYSGASSTRHTDSDYRDLASFLANLRAER